MARSREGSCCVSSEPEWAISPAVVPAGRPSGERMSRLSLVGVFLLGTLSSLLATLLADYLRACLHVAPLGTHRPNSAAVGLFLLPDTSQLHVLDDEADPTQLYVPRSPRVLHDDTENKSLEAEALSSLYAAVEMKRMGKQEKAQKLFQHALALCPKHPDILNLYGEFLEDTQRDILAADHMYGRALAYSPRHSRAAGNRQRTLPLVEELDQGRFRRIDQKRDALINIPATNAALRRVKKEAYYQQIYHTVGIEGNSMSLAQTRHIVETRMAVGGKSIMEHNEILGLDAALKYINSTLVQKLGDITVEDILEVHRRVIGYAEPLEAGHFRRTQVYVGDHVPPPPSELTLLMRHFVQWLNSEAALSLHPIAYAAEAHYRLVFVHPFSDGNGRTSRLLMNLILMQAGYPPVIIRKQDRMQYYEHLEVANEGEIRPFVRFIADCTEKTLDVYLWATKEYAIGIPALDDDGKTIVMGEED